LSGDDGKAHAAGCDGYVTKPYSPRELLAKHCQSHSAMVAFGGMALRSTVRNTGPRISAADQA
jgi:CheY-like chemotaxis protein